MADALWLPSDAGGPRASPECLGSCVHASQQGSSSPTAYHVRQRQQRRGLQLLPGAGASGQAAWRWGAAKQYVHMPVLPVCSAKRACLGCCRHLCACPAAQDAVVSAKCRRVSWDSLPAHQIRMNSAPGSAGMAKPALYGCRSAEAAGSRPRAAAGDWAEGVCHCP